MQCAKCGFENPAEAKFCGRCGETMKFPMPPPPPPPGGEAVPQGLMIGIAIGSFFFFPLGLVMGAIYMNDPNPEKKKAGKLWMFISIGVIVLFCICGGLSALVNPNTFN